jgi:transposase-like protein
VSIQLEQPRKTKDPTVVSQFLGEYTGSSHFRTVARALHMQLESTITCPKCGHQATETMPTDACRFFYNCKGCGERLKPLDGDCCVFCSYGTMPCPPKQAGDSCCTG